MNAYRRIVPENHVTSVLAEESISERTIEMRETLGKSLIKLDQVAHKWSKNDGMNILSRVIILHVGKIPKKHTPLQVKKIIHDEIPHAHETIHTSKSTSTREDHHEHGHSSHAPLIRESRPKAEKEDRGDLHDHEKGDHGHSSHAPLIKGDKGGLKNHDNDHGTSHSTHHEAHEHDKDHGHNHSNSHAAHSHESHTDHHDHGHSHDDHKSGHGTSHGSEHSGSHFASFTSTGHWCGDQGCYLFGMLGRVLGEIMGYIVKLAGVLLIFGPTRTGILVLLAILLLNWGTGASIPAEICGGIGLIIHLIFSGIQRLSSGGGNKHGGHGGGGHGESHGHH